MSQAEIHLTAIESQPFSENTYVLSLPGRSDCVVVDPGFEPDLILDHLERQQLTPAAILNTHGHSDHIAGNEAMKARWPNCPLVIGRLDAPMLTDPKLNLSAAFLGGLVSPPADLLLDDGHQYSAAGFDFLVRWIPGHSPGHIVFIWQAGTPVRVLGGDVLFAGSIGRTDFPGGSLKQLTSGIHEKLFTLPDDTIVYPGHGPETTIGEEKRTNPFVGLG